LGDDLEVSAWAEDGTVMGIRHRTLAVDGVQFHPEAVLTEGGHRLIANWLRSCGFGQALVNLPDGPLAEASRSAGPIQV
jgi:para-aminobenzoate synthetase component 2